MTVPRVLYASAALLAAMFATTVALTPDPAPECRTAVVCASHDFGPAARVGDWWPL